MNDDVSDNLCEVLDTEFVPEETEGRELMDPDTGELVTVPPTATQYENKAKAEEDFELGRELLHRTTKSMMKALGELDVLASQVETAGFWDSYAKVIEQAGKTAKDMMELHQKKDSLAAFIDEGHGGDQHGNINIDNAVVYTGTIADMQRQLKKENSSKNSGKNSGKNDAIDTESDQAQPNIQED